MAKNNNEEPKDEHGIVENVEHALTKTEMYIEENQKSLLIILAAILVVVGGYLAYQGIYVKGMEEDANADMFKAERYFELDSFNLALNGDPVTPGFLSIIDKYGVTDAANLANYYAGICYDNLGQYDQAIEHLQAFETKSVTLQPISLGATGDCYMQKGDADKALDFYKKAIAANSNELTTPIYLMKAGMVLESKGQHAEALELYERIRKEFPRSAEARTVEVYIARAELKAGA